MKNLSNTQQELLNALRIIRASGEKAIEKLVGKEEYNDKELLEMIGVHMNGNYVSNIDTKIHFRLNCNRKTYHTLLSAGLISCQEGIWFAI